MARLHLQLVAVAAALWVLVGAVRAPWYLAAENCYVVGVHGDTLITWCLTPDYLEILPTFLTCSGGTCVQTLQLANPVSTSNSYFAVSYAPVNAGQFQVLAEAYSSASPAYNQFHMLLCTAYMDGKRSLSCVDQYDPFNAILSTSVDYFIGARLFGRSNNKVQVYDCDVACVMVSELLPGPTSFLQPGPSITSLFGGTALFVPDTSLAPGGVVVFQCPLPGKNGTCTQTQVVRSGVSVSADYFGTALSVVPNDYTNATSGYAMFVSAPGKVGVLGNAGAFYSFLCSNDVAGYGCINSTVKEISGPVALCGSGGCKFGASTGLACTYNQCYVGAAGYNNDVGAVGAYNCTDLVLCFEQGFTGPNVPGAGEDFGVSVQTSYSTLAVNARYFQRGVAGSPPPGPTWLWVQDLALP